jgi:hypothetical protein
MVGGTFSHSYQRENNLHRMCPALSTNSAVSVAYENGHSCQAGVFRLPTGASFPPCCGPPHERLSPVRYYGRFRRSVDVGSRDAPDDHGRASRVRHLNPEPTLAFRDDFARQTRLEFSKCNFFEHLLIHRDCCGAALCQSLQNELALSRVLSGPVSGSQWAKSSVNHS